MTDDSLTRRSFLRGGAAVAGLFLLDTEPGGDVLELGIEGIDIAANYQDYITPDDPVVQEYADIMTVDEGSLHLSEDLRLQYQRDFEDWKLPEEYLTEKIGDCEDHALAFASILENKGYDTRIVIGVNQTGGHTRVEYQDGDSYYMMDVGKPLSILERDNGDWKPITMFGTEEPLGPYEHDW